MTQSLSGGMASAVQSADCDFVVTYETSHSDRSEHKLRVLIVLKEQLMSQLFQHGELAGENNINHPSACGVQLRAHDKNCQTQQLSDAVQRFEESRGTVSSSCSAKASASA